MIVLKFGGTSVASKVNLDSIANILLVKTSPWLVVVSAISGVTSELERLPRLAMKNAHVQLINSLHILHRDFALELDMSHQDECLDALASVFAELSSICESIHILNEVTEATFARVCAFGEILSVILITHFLRSQNLILDVIDSRDFIIAEGDFRKAVLVQSATKERIQNLSKNNNYITSGFIASNMTGKTMLLGRGGSDYTASIFAANLHAERLEIWSDVNGMLTTNPDIVSDAIPIKHISYKEALEMAYFGAKVLYPPTIQPVMQANIPIVLKNTVSPEHDGTLISSHNAPQKISTLNSQDITGVTSLSGISLLNFTGVGLPKTIGAAKRFFSAIEACRVNIILISQSCAENSICIAVNKEVAQRAKVAIEKEFTSEINDRLVNPVTVLEKMCIIAVIGDNMKHRAGLSGLIFQTLGQNGINLYALAQGSSERNISMVVHQENEHKSVNAVYERFFKHTLRRINLFVAGAGNVGSAFLSLLSERISALKVEHQLDIRLIGLANSKKLLFDVMGLSLEKATNNHVTKGLITKLESDGESYSAFSEFIDKVTELNMANSLFVDNTASSEVAAHYQHFLNDSIGVVTCNKIAQSDDYSIYTELKQLSQRKQAAFCYETAVGAALPILRTIHDLRQSGDKILRIQAVLSGSLNFIFNQYDTSSSFADVVKQAVQAGYTEPNPMIDLSGLDVIRKLIILSREAGYEVNESEVSFRSFLPDTCQQISTNDELFHELEKAEPHFKNLYSEAKSNGAKLKVVAEMRGNNLNIDLRHITVASPFYHLENKDNIIAFTTARYADEPLIIKGAGAGAEVTASGVFSDVLFAANQLKGEI